MPPLAVEANDAVIPAGKPVATSATVPVKPFCATTLIAAVAFPPAAREIFEFAESLKLGAAAMVTGTVTF